MPDLVESKFFFELDSPAISQAGKRPFLAFFDVAALWSLLERSGWLQKQFLRKNKKKIF